MFQPRNSLVTITEIKDAETQTKHGIVVPGSLSKNYVKCRIVAVGPGNFNQEGAISEMHDLAPGQVVLVKLASTRRDPGTGRPMGFDTIGFEFKHNDENIILIEQSQIVAILEQPDH